MARSSSLRTKSLQWLLAALRWPPLGAAVRFIFKYMNPLLPMDRLCENRDWLAFHHPQPEYSLHILILPKQWVARLSDAPEGQPGFYLSLFELVKQLVECFDLEAVGYRLITNGGPNQSIPQWHWHLVSAGWRK
jgi:histidine triad (HIT) family protein